MLSFVGMRAGGAPDLSQDPHQPTPYSDRLDFNTRLNRLPSDCHKSFGMPGSYAEELDLNAAIASDFYEEYEPFFTRQEQRDSTVTLVPNADGKPVATYPDGSLVTGAHIYTLLSDAIDGEQERLVVGSTGNFHSQLSQGQPTRFAGEIWFNDEGRIDDFESISLESGHYQHPALMYARPAAQAAVTRGETGKAIEIMQKAEAYENLLFKKFSLLVDEPRDLDDVETTPYGLEALQERLNADFPEAEPYPTSFAPAEYTPEFSFSSSAPIAVFSSPPDSDAYPHSGYPSSQFGQPHWLDDMD